MSSEPTRPSSRTRLSPEARRAQLLTHAISAFADHGIERAVHADVAERAGVSTPTVFKYFPTRDVLVNTVLDEVENKVIELIEQVPENSGLSTHDMVHQLAKAVDVLCGAQPELTKVSLAWSVAFSSVRDRYVAFQELQLDMLTARLSPTAQERSDARIILGVALLYIRMYFDGSSEDVRQRYVNRVAELWEPKPTG